ncbi:MAG: hypothetical protein ACP5QA_11615 [Phycisphaerae bacterium]
MAELPKDPQQLAQDILAGRISIQQLQAEQARRRAAQEALRQNIRTRPATSGAAARQPGNRQVVKPANQPSASTNRQSRPAATSDRNAARANAKRSPSQNRTAANPVEAVSDSKVALTAAKIAPAATKPAAVSRTPAQTVRAVMNNPHALRSVFVLSELLDKPLSLRQDPLDRF